MQHYLHVRRAVDDFRTYADDQISRLAGGAKEDLQRKYASLLAFDFEAAARLRAWESLGPIIKVCTQTILPSTPLSLSY